MDEKAGEKIKDLIPAKRQFQGRLHRLLRRVSWSIFRYFCTCFVSKNKEKKRAKEKAQKEAIKKRTERNRRKYSGQ